MMNKKSVLTLLALVSINAQAEESWTISSGATYTSGDYDSNNTTEIYYLPVSVKYKKDKWRFKLTVPYINMTGPQNVIRDIGQVTQTTTVKNKTVDGLGDIIVSANYQFLYLPKSKLIFDDKAKVKFGTDDQDDNLVTGKNDYTLSAGAYKLMGNFTPYITFGRRFYGETSQIQLDNVYLGSAGAMYKATDKLDVGVDYYTKQKTASHRSATRQLTAYTTVKLDKNWKLQSYLIKGFSDNSPDYGLGFSLIYKFSD